MNDPVVVREVVRYLGRIACILTVGGLILVGYVVQQSSGNRTVDPAAIGAVTGIVGLAGTVLGMLGGVLISIRSGPADRQEPIEARIVNQPDDAVPVEPGA